ncbi:cleavage induced hypothetical protein [Phytophthora infestans T30-4]|uniref:PX domain-containing protein n=2 Tax=Phytophthora infestans TaxID=4787 RepID=D0N007_PHYIT|nr:cleavage induced hypothetical protein [Phytophthora infestans T30-4]EEY65820.1 cleavage induced hypothetical protein [Phytophthora infestans T30-4]KAF4047287.1 PX domain-containing protein [Phytophthora infestans]KAF4139438.1 PX domain-containing protein [Phytophthora infestans]|eukprot:XP_002906419.1 cleavage induced hypothetical protein [Phytophthora infestans T30-4]
MNPTSRYAYSRNGEQGRVDEKCLVRVQIPTVDSTDGGKVRYHVRVTNIRSGQVWESPRRFSEFLQLRNDLIDFFAKTDKKCPGCRNYEKVLNLFEFPRKHVFTSVTPVVINYRKKALRSFVALLASHTFTTTPKCPTCSGFPFASVRDWLTTGVGTEANVATDAATRSPTNDAIRDTLDVKEFTTYHPVSNAMPVDQEGRFVGSATPKYSPPVTSPTKQMDSRLRSPPRPQPKKLSPKEDPKSQLRYSDGASSTSSVTDPPSPPSVDEFVMPTPAPVGKDEDYENDIEGEDDADFNSFVASSTTSSTTSEGRKDQPAREPPASDDSPAARKETTEKKHFKFTRSSIGSYSERSSVQPRESSMINIDDDDEDEGLNMDFMNSVYVAPAASK